MERITKKNIAIRKLVSRYISSVPPKEKPLGSENPKFYGLSNYISLKLRSNLATHTTI